VRNQTLATKGITRNNAHIQGLHWLDFTTQVDSSIVFV